MMDGKHQYPLDIGVHFLYTSGMTTTRLPSLATLINRQASSFEMADRFLAAADAVALIAGSGYTPLHDEVTRLRAAADEYSQDADDQMEEIMERFTPEQFEAALA